MKTAEFAALFPAKLIELYDKKVYNGSKESRGGMTMAYCSNCGAMLTEGMRFCPNCGAQIQTPVYAAPAANSVNRTRTDYSIILIDKGTCTKTHAKELLMDVFGYTSVEALSILDTLPVQIAVNLNYQQAGYAAQALSEYGMQVSVQNANGYTDLGQYASTSVYDSKGSFLSNVLTVLATMGVVNKVTKVNRWQYPIAYSQQYHPVYKRSAPPVHIRRTVGKPVTPPKPFAPQPVPPKPAAISPKPQRSPLPPQNAPVVTKPTQITPLQQMKPGPKNPNGRGGNR